ncbi:MAG TPA: ABC transporter ATP-binding protein [Pirellulales bacterium]|nr:ABC transporter ATP-binding protein [Pirellulales bacterium]
MKQPGAVNFNHVSKVYRRRWIGPPVVALDDITFSIKTGEVFGLIGPNRAGKTTLLKILLTICRPTQGEITRLGRPWSIRSTLAQVGYVHESPAFPRYLNAAQVLTGYGKLSGLTSTQARRRAAELLEQVDLADRRREAVARFSKGMLQRLALAQALVNEPKLLVLDEPSEGMDLSARKLLRRIIREQQERGHTIVLVSHALADVELLCDRIAVLRDGRAVFVGPAGDLKRDSDPACAPEPLESAVGPLYEGACT